VELDDTHVYFTDDEGALFRMPKGGPPFNLPELLGSVPDYIQVIALDATNIYVLTTNATGTDGGVWSLPKSGGTARQLASGLLTPFELAVDANNVYWVSAGTFDEAGFRADGKIEKVSKNGTSRTVLASGLNLPVSVVSDSTNVFFGETGLSPSSSSRGLRSVPVGGGPVTKITSSTGVGTVALNGNDIYFANIDILTGGELLRMPKTGGNATSLVKGLQFVTHMSVSGDRLYYFNSDDVQMIAYVPIIGGAPSAAVTGDFLAEQFAVDECAIYSIDSSGALIRTPR
jgi:hypothetical protein